MSEATGTGINTERVDVTTVEIVIKPTEPEWPGDNLEGSTNGRAIACTEYPIPRRYARAGAI